MQKILPKKQSLLSRLKASGQKLRFFDVLSLGLFGSFITDRVDVDNGVDLLRDFDQHQTGDNDFVDFSSSNDIIGDVSNAVGPD
jgi:predicted nucleotidyltransferase